MRVKYCRCLIVIFNPFFSLHLWRIKLAYNGGIKNIIIVYPIFLYLVFICETSYLFSVFGLIVFVEIGTLRDAGQALCRRNLIVLVNFYSTKRPEMKKSRPNDNVMLLLMTQQNYFTS
jgi:hypothetical protein